MEIKLNIYDDTMREVRKTYTVENFKIKFGTIEDVIKLIDLDKMQTGSDTELANMAFNLVTKSFESIKDILKCMFEGLNDDEIKNTDIFEVVHVIVAVVKYAIKRMSTFASEKNV